LFYKEIGNTAGPLIVLIHGGQTDHRSLENLANNLPDYYCILMDLPGHGENGVVVFSIEKSIEEIKHIIDQKREDKKVVIIGLSLGSIIARQFLIKFPQSIDLAVLGSGTIIPDIGYYLSQNWFYVSWLFRKKKKYFDSIKLSKQTYKLEMREIIKYAHIDPKMNEIESKVLLLHGDMEKEFIKKSTGIIAQYMKNYDVIEIENAEHCYNRDNSNVFNEIIKNYLNEYIK
jgi:pimeloyl-ACP methyl ester carboxylesterase